MAIDKDDFIKNFEEQIRNLESLKKAAQDGIDRAYQNLKRINDGDPIEEVFRVPPKQ
ncbi:hypothetical protein [Rhizobium sp. LjRoot258]|jgi:hypothetical protein|uniref:hypothetical protein n=1 Tax=Rhizobium sp. LjRoot258 TaxID=3342299 RepID=UPI003ECD8634